MLSKQPSSCKSFFCAALHFGKELNFDCYKVNSCTIYVHRQVVKVCQPSRNFIQQKSENYYFRHVKSVNAGKQAMGVTNQEVHSFLFISFILLKTTA